MPLILNNNLPVYKLLLEKSPEVLAEAGSAQNEQIHDLLILNLMSDKIGTELQYLQCLGAARQFIRVDFMRQVSYRSSNQDETYLQQFYLSLEDVRNKHYDAMIITGAPLEHVPIKDTLFWDEFCRILNWSRTNVHSVMYNCWAAYGAAYYDFGISKLNIDKKYFGIYNLQLHQSNEPLFAGCDSDICIPLSRATEMDMDALRKTPDLMILASAAEGTPVYLKSSDNRCIYVTGHPEYNKHRLAFEYERDSGKKYDWEVNLPLNYFPNDDSSQTPTDQWVVYSRQVFRNWMDFYVDKTTAINRQSPPD